MNARFRSAARIGAASLLLVLPASGVQAASLKPQTIARLNADATYCSKDAAPSPDLDKHRAAAFPDAASTGIKPGIRLTRYIGTLHIKTDNAVVSNLDVEGNIVIEANNVTVRNTRLISYTPWHALTVLDNAMGFMLMDSEIDGRGSTINGVYGFATVLRTHIHGVENGLTIWGPSIVCDSLIHDLRSNKPDPHYDGIQINGGTGISIVHNTVINENNQTSAVIMGNTFAGLSDILIDGNRLVGGGYTLYLTGEKGGGAVKDKSITITNNRLEKGYWGSFALYREIPLMSCNRDLSPKSLKSQRDRTGCRQQPEP